MNDDEIKPPAGGAELKGSKDLALHYMTTLVEVARESFLILDSDLRVVTANPTFYQNFKVKPAQTENVLLYDLGNGQWNIPDLRRLLEEILPGKKVVKDYEVKHIFETIGEKTILLNARQIDIDTVKMIVLAMEDITVRKELETKLAATAEEKEDVRSKLATTAKELAMYTTGLEAKNEAILASIGDGLVATDAEGKIVLVNKAFETMLGWKASEVQGKLLCRVIPMINEDGKVIAEPERPINIMLKEHTKATTTTTTTTTYNYKRRDGTFFPAIITISPILVGGEFVGGVEIFRDITKEKALVKDLEKFKLAVENTSDHIIITDADGIILFANKAAEKITGYSQSEIIGNRPSLWGKKMPKEFYEKMWKTIKVEKKNFAAQITNKRKNGTEYEAEVKISSVLDENSNILFFIGLERDITKEKEIDKAKTEFISLASHQLRTPLSAMKWFLEMLLTGDAGSLNVEQLEFVKNINNSNERMISLINDLLNTSRIESGRLIIKPKPTDLQELVKGVIAEIQQKINNKKLEVSLNIQENLPLMNIDYKMIRQVYMNFLTNAVKYTNSGGKIQIFIFIKDNEIISRVSDSGVGIPKEEQPKIFERFFRASNAIKVETDGTGLGLYLTKAIVESSGGKIGFQSGEGKGTTFWFSLPTEGMKPKSGDMSLSL